MTIINIISAIILTPTAIIIGLYLIVIAEDDIPQPQQKAAKAEAKVCVATTPTPAPLKQMGIDNISNDKETRPRIVAQLMPIVNEVVLGKVAPIKRYYPYVVRPCSYGVAERDLSKLIRNNKCVLGKGTFGKVLGVTVE